MPESCLDCGAPLARPDASCSECGAISLSKRPLLEGKWRLEKKLGSGGMGTVHLATELELERKVAIKMLSPGLAHEAEVVTRFEREARMLAKLEHPNLVPIHAVGRRDGQPFIVMKYLEGTTLSEFLRKRGQLPLDETLDLMRQISAGLGMIHSKGVVHRDLKPGNIIVAPDGHATLLDLGVAHDPRSQLTRAGVAIGTPRYMAPEQAMGTDKIDQRADVYSLGVLLYEMLTGQPLFEGESDHSVMRKHVNTHAPDAALTLPGDIPRGVAEVLNRSLAKLPEDRYQSVGEMFSALEQASGGRATPTPMRRLSSPGLPATSLPPRRSVPSKQRSLSGTDPDESLPSLGTLFRGPNGERRVPRVLVGLCVGAVVFGAGLALLRSNAPEPMPLQIHDLNARAPVVEELPVEAPPPPPTAKLTQKLDDERSFPPPRNDRLPDRTPDRVKRQGNAVRRTERLPIQSERGRTGELRVTTKLEGQISWAWIDIDGVRRGQSPLVLKVDVGPHEVRLARDGFKTITRQVDVSSESPFKLTVELRR